MAQTSDRTTSSSSPPLALETSLVEKTFQKDGTVNHVLSRMSLVLGPGELGALIGTSGCGKSTFLKIVAGLEPFDSGDVKVLGRQPGFGRYRGGIDASAADPARPGRARPSPWSRGSRAPLIG